MTKLARRLVPSLARVALLVVASVVLYRQTLDYHAFFVDDAFISLRYSERLLNGQGLTWTDGERVEGYTNFLWVLLVAGVGAFQPTALVGSAKILGVSASLLTLAAVLWAQRGPGLRSCIPGAYGAAALAVSGPLAAWSVAGLEQPLLLAALAWGVVLSSPLLDVRRVSLRQAWPAGVCFALAVLTRPDGILMPAMACFGLLLARTFVPPTQAGRTGWLKRLVHDGLPSALVLGALPLLVLAAHLVFRKGYYGEWVPNTYHAKVAFTAERLALGVHYLSKGALFWVLGLPCLATAVAFAKDRHRRRRVLVLLPMLLAWVSYVVAIGGDIMPQRRHLLVALVLTVLLGAEGLAWLVARGGRTSLFAYVVAVVSVAALVVQQRDDPEKTWALRDLWHWPARPIGSFFRASFGDKDPLLAVDAAGALPYFWKGRALDMLGLNDAWLAKHPPSRFGTGPLAHELGDGDYVWRRKPDIIVFHLPTGLEAAEWRGGRELQAKAEFGAFYQFVTFETPLPTRETGHAWFRKEDSSLGVQRSATQIVVPGHLLSSDRRGRIRLDPEGWVGADVWPEAPARLDFLTLKPGRWLVAAEGRGHVTLSISDGPGRQPFARGVDRVVAVVPRSTSAVTIAAELAWGDMARVRSVTLTRQ